MGAPQESQRHSGPRPPTPGLARDKKTGTWMKGARLIAAVAAISIVAAFTALAAPSASAAYAGNVWVIYQNNRTNCPGGGNVVGISAAVGDIWTTGGGGDWGDNIIYPRVLIGAWNVISAQVWCKLPWYQGSRIYPGTPSQHTFYASYPGQNLWF